ncbi:MAG: hypothetical protein MUF45_03475 [Spirosomaceae bacterium]|nr:hypothetical protein [Spirosomataceae bacterium]
MKKLVQISLLVLSFFFVQYHSKAQTTLAAGDIAFTGYTSNTTNQLPSEDGFSFVLLKAVAAGTVINFTDNGWLGAPTNAFRTGETTITWTAPAGGLALGTEVNILGTTASVGTITGTVLSLSGPNGDQVLAYQGTSASPTFISAIHANYFSTTNGDPVTTTDANWDGSTSTFNASGLPPGLTSGTNAIWLGFDPSPPAPQAPREYTNGKFNCGGDLSTAASVRAAVNNRNNWTRNYDIGPGFVLPTGCSFIVAVPAPTINTNPSAANICFGANTSFTIAATGATAYQWQVNTGSGFANITNDAIYSGATTVTLTLTEPPQSFSTYQYRCVASNGSGSTNSNPATLTITPLPVSPSLLAKTPATLNVADGTAVSATFTAGSGGTGCSDDYRYTTDGGSTYLPYTPGSNISTTGLAAGSGQVFIEGRRANCSAGCQGSYSVLAHWVITPLPSGATTLNAGDIAFTAYSSAATNSDFSFVLLKNVGAGTTINFTDNGWLPTNVFRTGENTVTWTAPTGGLVAGTEITIAGLTATKSGGGSAGTVTGTALTLAQSGDQILAYRGTASSPTFISGIHMNVFVSPGDAVTTTAAAWDGAGGANGGSSSALPTGLTTGVNCIWIGTEGVASSEKINAKFGKCNLPAVAGSITALRAALNNQANWTTDNNNIAPTFTQPTGCNYLQALPPVVTVTGTPLTAFTTCSGVASTNQSFSVSGSTLTEGIVITAPTGYQVSTSAGSGFGSSVTLAQSGGIVGATTIYVRLNTTTTGAANGNITCVSGVTTQNVAVSGTVNVLPSPAPSSNSPICAGNTLTLSSAASTSYSWAGPNSFTSTLQNPSINNVTIAAGGTYTITQTNSSGCTASATVSVTVNSLPTAGASSNSPVNAGGTLNLTGTGSGAYLWAGPNSFSSTLSSPSITNVTSAAAGTYTVTVTNAGCTATATTAVVVNTVAAGSNSPVCEGNTLNLSAGGGVSYLWAGPNSFTSTTQNPSFSNATIDLSGVYSVTVTISGGGTVTATASVTVNPTPVPNPSSDSPKCVGQTLSFKVSKLLQ